MGITYEIEYDTAVRRNGKKMKTDRVQEQVERIDANTVESRREP